MLPSGDGSNQTRRSNNQNGMKWIRAENLTTQPQDAKILMVRYIEKGKFGPNVQLKLAFAGDTWFMSIPTTKADLRYKTLIENFGPDETNWVSQRILIYLKQDDFTEGYLMRIEVPTASTKKGGK